MKKTWIGKTYEDPEGVWEITEVYGDLVTVKCVQEGNVNYGEEFGVSTDEAAYFLGELDEEICKDIEDDYEAYSNKDFFEEYHRRCAERFKAAVPLMDDEIREELHREMAPCTDEEFYEAYCEKHLEKYGEEFKVM